MKKYFGLLIAIIITVSMTGIVLALWATLLTKIHLIEWLVSCPLDNNLKAIIIWATRWFPGLWIGYLVFDKVAACLVGE